MGEEERMARQQCWTGLKTRYESDRGPRRVMLMEKFFALRKTESVSMDDHLIEVKEVANLLEEVGVNIPDDIIVYYTLKNLPKEYEIFKRMQIAAQSLPTYEQLEAKLITEEAFIKFESQQKEEGEAFFSHHDRFRRPQSAPRSSNFSAAPNPRYSYASRRLTDSGGSSIARFPNQVESGGLPAPRYQHSPEPPGSAPRNNSQVPYQPRYRARGPE